MGCYVLERVPMYGATKQHKDFKKHLMEMYRVVLHRHSISLFYSVTSVCLSNCEIKYNIGENAIVTFTFFLW